MNSNHGKSGRWTRASFLVLIVVASLVLAACGSDDAEVDTQATEIAAGVAATLEAQAALTPVVIVVTPPPPTEPVGASAAPPAGIDLANLRLEADGSGDLPTLEDAIVQSPEGATITLGPGTYRLEHALTVGGSLHLVGAGRDQTEIIANVADWVLRFQGSGPFTATGITFRHDGDAPAEVVDVVSGEVLFQGCRFSGGVRNEGAGIGNGLALGDSASGEVSGSEFLDNHGFGILLWEQARVLIRDNLIRASGDTGIAFFGDSGGQALNNEIVASGKYGIYVDDRAAPTLEGNRLRDNDEAGIAYYGNAAGTAQGNVCAGSGATAIRVAENAAPSLVGNECQLEGTEAEAPVQAAPGREIVYSAWWNDNEDIYTMYADGTGVLQLTDDPARDRAPTWSPDGTRIAFVSERDGNAEIYVMNADGSGQSRLTFSPGEDGGPDWSPDGAWVAYGSDMGGRFGIYRISPDGGEPVRISPEDVDTANASWSPDGTRLAVTTWVNRTPILAVLNANTGELIGLTQEGRQDSEPAWSPDGQRIAFISQTDTEGNWVGPELYVIDANGLNRTRLTASDGSTEGSPTWSPDGTQIAFSGTWDGYGAIWRMNTDATELTRISIGSNPSGDPDWSAVAASARGPRFNPDGDPWCFNTPAAGAAGDWQVVAPRERILPGDRAEVGLRDKAGQAGVQRSIAVRIITPDESESVATATLTGDEWLMLVYPDDFSGGQTVERGAYTILWEAEGSFVACDGFIVGGGAGM